MSRQFWRILAITVGTLSIAHGQVMAQQQNATAVDRLRVKVASCFSPPPGATAKTVIAVTLEPDSSVKNKPKIIRKGKGRINEAFAKAAVRAILKCGPYGGLGLKGEITLDFVPPEPSPVTNFDDKSIADRLDALTARP
ncbi:hypothetical protein [Agrobacterium sp. 22-226-1]